MVEIDTSADANPQWTATVLTLFPEVFPGVLGASIIGSAREKGLWALEAVNIRDFSDNKHRNVDDTPAGGGPGMVLRADIMASALDSIEMDGRPILYMSPRGRPLTQDRVKNLSNGTGCVIICGRFEGLDQRVIEARGVEEVSIGDFILAGGEVAAQALIEACVRLRPSVLGAAESAVEESFEDSLLEYPLYTRPRRWDDRDIPEVLLSGDHAKIAKWRLEQREKITQARRPDLYEAYQRTKGDSHERD